MSVRSIAKFLKLKQLSARFNFNTTLTLNNKKFSIPVIKNMGLLNLSVKEDWFSELLKSLRLPKGSSFIDIGVNVGQTLLTFRSHYDNPYWGFEPNASCVFYLNTLIKDNAMKYTHIIPVGLSTESSLAKFYIKNDVDSAGTIVKDLRPDYYEGEEVNYVPLFSFDNLNMEEIQNISLIKIDVEGAELEVLTGLVRTMHKHKPAIICEVLDYHSEKSKTAMQVRADKLTAVMRSANYVIYRILHTGGKITFEKTDNITLKLWTEDSFNLNDYLFLPEGKTPFN